jgi:hypothetical protein
MLQRVLCRPLGAVGSMLSLLLWRVDGATGSFDLRHPSQLFDALHCSNVLGECEAENKRVLYSSYMDSVVAV